MMPVIDGAKIAIGNGGYLDVGLFIAILPWFIWREEFYYLEIYVG
jgi:hypothetical protein